MKKSCLVILGFFIISTFAVDYYIDATKAESLKLYVWVDFLKVRREPNQNSPVIAELGQGSEVEFLNEKTKFSEEITLHGKRFYEPWLRVKTYQHSGWVYGGALRPLEEVTKLCATAFPNREGTGLVTVNYKLAKGNMFTKVICPGGKSYSISFITEKPAQYGVALASNFDNYGGFYYKVIDGKVNLNQTGLLVTTDFLTDRTILNFSPLKNKKCDPITIKEIGRIKGWVVKDSWSLIKVADRGDFYLVLFERKGKNALACITYVSAQKLVLMDYYGEDRENNTWRVDDGGQITPDMFEFLAVFETKDGIEFVMQAYGAEGINIYYQQEIGNIFFPVIHDYRYILN